ncbi:MAG: DUF2934 domain-containing protein [Acidobacteriota bacterium]
MDLQEIRERFRLDESMRERIARRAFEIYANRGYIGGREAEDWLQAENELFSSYLEDEKHREAMEQAALEPQIPQEERLSPPAPTPKDSTKKRAQGSKTQGGATKTAKKSASKKVTTTERKSTS